ncbi:MAG: hypothetical protein CM1200mP30_24910 [Pseudomonadota bacterium]|nr:MAG: hypothetical protein CM1200mP30_24910 [Pseudomonadota bacterium]
MTSYDGLLLIFGTMVLLMTVTLGLIPSVIKKPLLHGFLKAHN